jgi:SAM-dependent methyltransferase
VISKHSRDSDKKDAKSAYESLAPFYDRITEGSDYVVWCDKLLEMAYASGLKGKCVLDVATGTGKMAFQLRERGFKVKGCDISPAMLREARQRPGFTREDFFVADMRSLPKCGRFDLIVIVDDALNYCLTELELENTLQSVGNALEHGGIVIADMNTIRAYTKDFTRTFVKDEQDFYQIWNGQTSNDFVSGGLASLKITLFESSGEFFRRYESIHEQKHFGVETLRSILHSSNLEMLNILGINPDGSFSEVIDESNYTKMFLVARNP